MIRIFIPLFLSCLAGQAQFKTISVTLGVNHPLIADVKKPPQQINPIPSTSGYYAYYVNRGTLVEKYQEKPGIYLSTKVQYAIVPKLFVSSGISLNFLQYKRSEIVEISENLTFPSHFGTGTVLKIPHQNGQPYPQIGSSFRTIDGPSSKTGNTNVLYASIPLLAGTTFLHDRLTILGGGVFSLPVYASQYEREYSLSRTPMPSEYPPNNLPPPLYTLQPYDVKKNTTDHFTTLSAGAMVQIGYRLMKNFQADLTLQKDFTSIYKTEYQSAGKARLTSISLGISYTFFRFSSL